MNTEEPAREPEDEREEGGVATVCPVCGGALEHQKCKVVCRSAVCVYRIVFNCAEF